MEIQEFARSVLLGGSLEEKLLVPVEFSDERPEHALSLPDFPARPEAIRFDRSSRGPSFPGHESLRNATERGVAMHVFAHHELMALELMALALLKFTDAPTAFRLGIAQTMLEEQNHFSAYRARGEELGIGFGELPLSGFFWNALHGMSNPIDYVTQISMTFEQANLDFAEFYAGLFERIGDDECARIMRKVYVDEVRHVAYGLSWFERLREPGESTWEAYRKALPLPLSPSWAKGIGFSERGRQAAGLDGEFIRQLRLYSRSKGRPPRVFISNPDADALPCFAGETYARPDQLAQVGRDLAPTLIFHSHRSDVLACRRPDTAFLERLSELGVKLPEFVAPGELEQNLLARGHVWSLDPWCRDPGTERLARRIGDRLKHPMPEAGDGIARWRDGFIERIRAAEVAEHPAAAGDCQGLPATTDLHFTICGHSGRSRRAQSVIRRIADPAGGFGGYLVGQPMAGVAAETTARLYRSADRSSPLERMREYAQSAREELDALGYRGPLSLLFSVRPSDAGELRPYLRELHSGIHLDGTASALAGMLQRRKVGVWLHLKLDRMRSAGFGSATALMTHLDALVPLETLRTPGGVLLKQGALATSCPRGAVHRFTLLLVGESLELLESILPQSLAGVRY